MLECFGQTAEATGRGFTADAGIDHAMRIAAILEPRFKQGRPGVLSGQTVTGREAVAVNKQGRCRTGGGRNQQAGKKEQDGAHE